MIRQTQSKMMVRLNEFVILDILTSFGFSKFFDSITCHNVRNNVARFSANIKITGFLVDNVP